MYTIIINIIGVPRSKRGDVWIFFAELYCNTTAPSPIDLEKFPNFNVPYEQLLKQLTKYQHAILIDLGKLYSINIYIYLLIYYTKTRSLNYFTNC